MKLFKKLNFWERMLALLKSDVEREKKNKTFYGLTDEEIDKDLEYPNYDKNNHQY